jgi:triacylglycerol lipase
MFKLRALMTHAVITVASLCFPWAANAASKPTDAAKSAQTKYPIVLVHGLLGFDRMLGTDYWYLVPSALRKAGATVLVAQVSAVNDNNVRGEQLLLQLKQWSAAKGYKKFNLIGHSQGGPTIRYTAGVAPDLVASVTTVGSPHVIDPTAAPDAVIQQLSSNPKSVASLGQFIDWLSGNAKLPQDPEALRAWASDTAGFNNKFPAGMPATPCGQGDELAPNGVYYYSIAGNKAKTNALDPSDGILKEGAVPSDGLVSVCGAHWGMVLRDDYPWNHLDEVNQIFGLIGKGAPDPVAFYLQQANRLKLKGL